MATIENLGAALFQQTGQSGLRGLPKKVKLPERSNGEAIPLPAAQNASYPPGNVDLPGAKDVIKPHVEQSSSSRPAKHIERMSIEELAAMLRKVNLTFDLFEIQASFSVDAATGDVTVKVINQRTGEVIRQIPPYKIPDIIRNLDQNLDKDLIAPLITDTKA
jgi:uncharacterized FlaG/YvyC family protein